MDKKNRTRKLILIGSAIVILGVAGYFGYKWWKDKQDKKDEKPPDDSSSGSTDFGSGVTSGGGSALSSNPFKTSDDLKKFQQWVIDVAKDSAILGSKGADGLWGKNSANAWAKYGERYQKETGTTVSTTTTTTSKGIMMGIVSLKKLTTYAGTPDSPTNKIEYAAGKPLGVLAYKKADGSLTIAKTSDFQKPIIEKGRGALLANFYYVQYFDTNTNTYRNVALQDYELNQGFNSIFKLVPKQI